MRCLILIRGQTNRRGIDDFAQGVPRRGRPSRDARHCLRRGLLDAYDDRSRYLPHRPKTGLLVCQSRRQVRQVPGWTFHQVHDVQRPDCRNGQSPLALSVPQRAGRAVPTILELLRGKRGCGKAGNRQRHFSPRHAVVVNPGDRPFFSLPNSRSFEFRWTVSPVSRAKSTDP